MSTKKEKWLVFFYSIPSKPVRNRVRIWRKLSGAGFISLKGSVYVLPYSPDNFEICQWLTAEVSENNGEAAFISTDSIEGVTRQELIDLFKSKRERDYLRLETRLDLLEKTSLKTGQVLPQVQTDKLIRQIDKLLDDFEQIRQIDYFPCPIAKTIGSRASALRDKIKQSGNAKHSTHLLRIKSKKRHEYQGKTWLTRTRPFIDRIASAWLISRFIDKKARFRFISRQSITGAKNDYISFDIDGGDFSHVGDLCTFEVLIQSFGLRQKTLHKIAEIVHELDLRDGKYRVPQADGLKEILIGVRKSSSSDEDCLKQGMAVFDLLYRAGK